MKARKPVRTKRTTKIARKAAPKSRIFTYRMLRKTGACASECSEFRRQFGAQVRVTTQLVDNHLRKPNFPFRERGSWLAINTLGETAMAKWRGARPKCKLNVDICPGCAYDSSPKALKRWAALFIAEPRNQRRNYDD